MTESHDIAHLQFPNEDATYRTARNALLEQEMELRRHVEKVAALRRTLPPGGTLKEDYRFVGENGPVKMSALFQNGRDTLALYSFMFGPERESPCPGCTHFLDGIDGQVRHIDQRLNFYIVAKSPLPRLLAFAKQRPWHQLHFLSTDGNSYDTDYFGDSIGLPKAVRKQQDFKDGEEWDQPILNVFKREGDTIRHSWGSELLYVPAEPGQEYRHNDLMDPMWNIFDTSPEGRGDFHPKLSY
jgi:predicted dithiol-disulfide oxidoreductase (DUF899 family)